MYCRHTGNISGLSGTLCVMKPEVGKLRSRCLVVRFTFVCNGPVPEKKDGSAVKSGAASRELQLGSQRCQAKLPAFTLFPSGPCHLSLRAVTSQVLFTHSHTSAGLESTTSCISVSALLTDCAAGSVLLTRALVTFRHQRDELACGSFVLSWHSPRCTSRRYLTIDAFCRLCNTFGCTARSRTTKAISITIRSALPRDRCPAHNTPALHRIQRRITSSFLSLHAYPAAAPGAFRPPGFS